MLPAGCWPLLFPAKLRAQMRAVPFLRRLSVGRFHDRYYCTLLFPRFPIPYPRPSIPLACLPSCRQIGQQTADYA